jgi:serine/threonine protein kinase
LKPANIFITEDGTIKIGDFGFITDKQIEKLESRTFGGTYLYMSPEQRFNEQYNHKADIFSLGLIFYELMMPIPAVEHEATLSQVRNLNFPAEFGNTYGSEYSNLVCKMLDKEASRRPETSTILEEIKVCTILKEKICHLL